MKLEKLILGAIAWACLLAADPAWAQYWATSYGGGDDEAEYGGSIRTTQDGGYVFVSSASSFGGGNDEDVWVVKLDAAGGVVWQKIFGGDGLDRGIDVLETNGGYLVAANTFSYGQGSSDVWILKLDANGAVSWQRTYGGGGAEEVRSITPLNDGGCYIAGLTNSFGAVGGDAWIVRLSSAGVITSEKRRHISASEGAVAISTSPFGYYMLGYGPGNNGSRDFWFSYSAPQLFVDTNHRIGSASSETPTVLSAAGGGGWFASGSCIRAGFDIDALLMKLSGAGSPSWQKSIGGPGWEWFSGGTATADGGYAAIGMTASYGAGARDIWIVRFSANGSVSWQKTYGGAADDAGYSIRELADGGFVAFAGTKSFGSGSFDAIVLRLTASGDIDPSCGNLVMTSLAQASDWAVQDDSQFDNTREDTTAIADIPAYVTSNTAAAQSTLCQSSAASVDLTGSWSSVRKNGRRVSGTFVCSNAGSQASGGFSVRLYLSKKSSAGRRATLLTTEAIGALGGNATVDIPVSGNAGRKHKYLVAVVDRDNAVAESNEGNNTISARIP